MDGMVELGFVDANLRALSVFPSTIDYQNLDVYGGPNGYILRSVINEVEAKTGITQEEIETRGYQVVSTIDAPTQAAIVAGVATMPTDHAPNLRVAALTMDPTTGAVTGMYGGADYLTIQRNAVTQDIAQAGSTFKPFALVAALERGKSLDTVYNGDQPKSVSGFDRPVRNFGGVSYGDIDLVTATRSSVNTVYVQLNNDVGPDATREVAVRAGIPEDTLGLEDNPSNVLGTASPHALDLASAYSTFATGGFATDPFIVARILDSEGATIYEPEPVRIEVFEADVMADANYALQQVVASPRGSGHPAAELGRPIAGKTGTSNENRSAWFVGYTPQVVGVVGLYQVGPNGEAEEITTFGGFQQITGGTVPVRVWTAMMGPILAPLDVVDFPPRANVGVATTPTPSPSPSPSPSASPSPSPSLEPTPLPTPTPTPTAGPPLLDVLSP
jgi:membrane peptidoglycan carboxypeptidase